MCARFSLFATPDQIARLLDIDVPQIEPRYNIAPTQIVIGAIARDHERQIRDFRWGLIPSWAKDETIGQRMINARAETIREKSAYASAVQRRRCVIPASGFFEWRSEPLDVAPAAEAPPGTPDLFEEFSIPRAKGKKPRSIKQPYFLSLKSGEPFGFAGLYEYWRDPEGNLVRSCTILTTEPNDLVAPIHDRMPVILKKEQLDLWMDCEKHTPEEISTLLHPIAAEEMTSLRVSLAANDPKNESPSVLRPV